MFTPPEIVIAAVVLAVLIFVPILRRLLGLIVRLAIFFVAVGIAAAGVTMILNNETIFERPGLGQRVVRFLTMNSAACQHHRFRLGDLRPGEPAACARACRDRAAQARRRKKAPAEIQTTRNVVTSAAPAPLDDVFPELIRRSFPGIPRQKLFKLSQDTVNSLGGWRIVKVESRATSPSIASTRREFSRSRTT